MFHISMLCFDHGACTGLNCLLPHEKMQSFSVKHKMNIKLALIDQHDTSDGAVFIAIRPHSKVTRINRREHFERLRAIKCLCF